MKIIFMGTPDFAVPILRALQKKYEISLVISQPNRVKKKGVYLDTPVASCAKELQLEVYQPEKIIDGYEYIKSKEADILITAAYGQYVPTKILKLFKNCLNVHASLLPKHRGGAPIQRCLMQGEPTTGVSIMEMVKELDAGRVYAQVAYDILPSDNATTLFEKLSLLGRDLLLNVIEDVYTGKNLGVLQNEQEASYSSNLSAEEERIFFHKSTKEIIHQIRGLSYEPGAYIWVSGMKVKVFQATEVLWEGTEPCGMVLSTKKRILIKTKDSAIELTEVLVPGKKRVSGKDFSNGQKIFMEGTILNSDNL